MSDVVRIEGVTRVQRTFAFVDVSGFTAFTDREGDAAAVEMLETIRAIIRRLSSVHGVRVAKWLGDGAMLVGVEPEPVIEAQKRCGGGSFAFVGDSTYDVKAARGAKVPVIGAAYGYCDKPPHELGADAVIDSLDQLIPTLEAL